MHGMSPMMLSKLVLWSDWSVLRTQEERQWRWQVDSCMCKS